MPQNLMGKRVGGNYPRFVSKLTKTADVNLDQPPREGKASESHIPEFLRGSKVWRDEA